MITPFRSAAGVYLAAGWWPIPVSGKAYPVAGATGYQGTVTAEKIDTWASDPSVGENIAVRHQGTLAIDVDAGYGDKDGVTALARWAAERALPELPPTWSSTARGGETGSRQYLYRIPADVPLKTKPCPSVELCCWHHRFTVVAPSVHPDTGTAYTWYPPGGSGVPPSWGPATGYGPAPAELPELPTPWWEQFVAPPRAELADGAEVPSLTEMLAGFAAGEPDTVVARHLARWSDPAEHVGHDEFKAALITALMFGREGRPGVRALAETLVSRLSEYLAEARPGTAEHELESLISTCTDIAARKPVQPRRGELVALPARDDTGLTVIPRRTGLGGLVKFVARSSPAERDGRLVWAMTRAADAGLPLTLLIPAARAAGLSNSQILAAAQAVLPGRNVA